MDIENLIGTMIEGSLTSRRKRSYGAGRFLRHGSGSFINASTLLTVGGLIWGAIETMQQQSAAGTGGSAPAPAPAPPRPISQWEAPPPPSAGSGPGVPPPLPPAPVPAGASSAAPVIPDGATRLIRLMVSASRADGQASEAEKQAILEHARKAGVEALVEEEWLRPTPLSSVIGVVNDPRQRADLYVLAYAIVRADEGISGAERIYLAQLASMLQLDKATVERLEGETDNRIEAQV
jgi:uncharacterized membrane protein YebE (DUF533 family)